MRYQIKEQGLGGILDQAVALTKNHFGLLIGVTLVLQVPFGLISSFVQLAIAPQVPANPTPQDMMALQQEALANLWITGPMALVALVLVVPITNAAVIHAIASQYLEKSATVGSSMRRAFGILLPLIGTWILLYLAVLGGTLLCLIPGILFAFWFILATQVVVIEGVAGFTALKRSRELMRGNIATVFALGMIIGVINWAILFGAFFVPQQHLRVIGSVAAQAIATVFGAAAFVVFYFSCRCKHENFDLVLLAQSVDAESSAETVSETAPEP